MAAITRKHYRSDDYLPPSNANAKKLRRITSIGSEKAAEFISAVKQLRESKVRSMLEAKISPNFMHEGLSPLTWAVWKNNGNIAKLLLEGRADPDQLQEETGDTALGAAIFKGRPQIARLLLEYSADPLARDSSGVTAYVYALYRNDIDRFSFLPIDKYSRNYLAIALLANVSALDGLVAIEDRKVDPIGYSIYVVAKHFLQMAEETKLAISEERIDAWKLFQYLPHKPKKLFQRIKSGKTSIIPVNTYEHNFAIVVRGNAMVICNRGMSGGLATSNFQFFTIDPELFTLAMIVEILRLTAIDQKEAMSYCYQTLPKLLHAQADPDRFQLFAEKTPKDSECGNCCVASLKAANRAALFFELGHITRAGIENAWMQSKRESTLFREYAERHCAEVVGEPLPPDVKSLIQRSQEKRAKRKL